MVNWFRRGTPSSESVQVFFTPAAGHPRIARPRHGTAGRETGHETGRRIGHEVGYGAERAATAFA
ncbi:hypothetical protein [Streptosporangium sp. NPDC051022]|uniref:hypothetical protein n=1 Tax=Streptosporangium sp. NPDC051022 TaxID=3155752 RepID=UPI00342FDD12